MLEIKGQWFVMGKVSFLLSSENWSDLLADDPWDEEEV